MEEQGNTRRQYDKAFKEEAVRLVTEGHRKVSSVARDLGIEANMLYRWKRELETGGMEAFPGKGKSGSTEEENEKLRKQLAIAEEERDILKKALAVFSRRGK